jgi:hypothetical protein
MLKRYEKYKFYVAHMLIQTERKWLMLPSIIKVLGFIEK